MISTQRRFWRKVDKRSEDECWLWLGELYDGYGHFTFDGTTTTAHRFSLRLTYNAPIDPDLEVGHLCENRACVNPKHLKEMTPQENVRMQEKVTRETCINGHDRTPTNTYYLIGGSRQCLACSRERARKQIR